MPIPLLEEFTMFKTIIGKGVAVLAGAGILATAVLAGAAPASAASCGGVSGTPIAQRDHKFVLWNSTNLSGANQPFKFVLYGYRDYGDHVDNRSYTYNPSANYRVTGGLNVTAVTKLESWYKGTKCLTWTGEVRGK